MGFRPKLHDKDTTIVIAFTTGALLIPVPSEVIGLEQLICFRVRQSILSKAFMRQQMYEPL